MSISTLDALFAGMKTGALMQYNKATLASQVIGGYASLWRATGYPAQGAIPGAAAICDDSLTGAFPLPARTGAEERIIGFGSFNNGQSGASLLIEDRLAHMGGLNGTLTSAQTVNVDVTGSGSNLVARKGPSDYSQVRWWLEWYTATGSTAVTATVNVTYVDNTTEGLTISLPATVAAGRRYEILPVNGKFIKSVQSVQLSATTGTAGSFGVTATRVLALMTSELANKFTNHDWAALGAPEVEDNACLTFSQLNIATSTLASNGFLKMVIG